MVKHKSFYKFDKDIGFWGAPNLSQNYTSELNDNPTLVTNDKHGIRTNNTYNYQYHDSIITIGGSHSWGAGVITEQRYSEILANKLNRQIINMGQASLGIDQICVAIMKKTKLYNPKIIIVEQYPWAVLRITNNYVNGYIKPYFSLNSNHKIQFKKVPKIAKYSLIRKIIGNYRSYKKQLNEYQSGIDLETTYDPMLDPIFLSWKYSHYAYLYQLLEKILVIIKDYCQENNIKLLFTLGVLYQQFKSLNYPNKSKLINYNAPKKQLRHILEKLNIDYIDTTDTMISQHSTDDPVIFHDGHINAKGHQILANLIEGKLNSKQWV